MSASLAPPATAAVSGQCEAACSHRAQLFHRSFMRAYPSSSQRVGRVAFSCPARKAATVAHMRLEGRTAVVSGANRGIGLELVKQLLDKGNTVVATARQPGAATELQELAAASDGRLQVTQLDVASPESIESWAAALKATTPHIDLLVNNAGVTDGWKELAEVTAQDMLHCFIPNTIGPLLVTQQLHKQGLLGRSGGSGSGSLVANMSSKLGSIDRFPAAPPTYLSQMGSVSDNGSGSDYSYRASKAALNIVNKSLSIDLAPDGITCVLLHPGYVKTDMTGWEGNIDTQTCVAGLLAVLESDRELNGRWYDFKGEEVPS